MAPKILEQGEKGYTLAVNVWSIGCTIFFLLSNELIFLKHDEQEQRHARWDLLVGLVSPTGQSCPVLDRHAVLTDSQANNFCRALVVSHPQVRMTMSQVCSSQMLVTTSLIHCSHGL